MKLQKLIRELEFQLASLGDVDVFVEVDDLWKLAGIRRDLANDKGDIVVLEW